MDGPWKLSSFAAAASGPVASFLPNPAYSGSQRPALSKVTYYAYPDAASEYTALKNGQLDFGYVPPQDLTAVTGSQLLPPTSPLGSTYTLSEAYPFGIQSLVINFSNPTLGPAFRQLYVRQALQELIDQNGMISSVDRGYGYPTSGAVPNQPSSPWVPPIQNSTGPQAPYAYSIGSATSLLTSHGWKRVGGVLTCETAALCGPGVAAGTKLSVTLDYSNGNPAVAQEVALVKADAGQAGIRINPVARSHAAIDGESAPCTPGQR